MAQSPFLSTDPNAAKPAPRPASPFLSTDPNAAKPAKPTTHKTASAEDFTEKPKDGGNLLSGWWEVISPMPMIQAVSQMTADEFQNAKAAAKRGDYTGAVLHTLNAQ